MLLFTIPLLPLLLFLALTSPTTAQCTPGPAPGTRCRVECGIDYYGGDYSFQSVSSFDECIALCNQDVRCVDAQYHRGNGVCYLKDVLTQASVVEYVDSVICDGEAVTTTSAMVSTTLITSTTTSTPTPTSCINGPFKIQITFGIDQTNYFYDYGNNPSFVSVTYDITAAGQYTLNDSLLYSVAVPGAVVYTISGFGPGPNGPPDGRTLYEGVPGTLPDTTGENLPVLVTVTDQETCSLAFTDGVRSIVGIAGFRGGPSVYLVQYPTTSNFQQASSVVAIPV